MLYYGHTVTQSQRTVVSLPQERFSISGNTKYIVYKHGIKKRLFATCRQHSITGRLGDWEARRQEVNFFKF
jgi:hypothetical protein